MKLELDRSDVTRMLIACTTISQSLKAESVDENTNEERRLIAARSAGMWDRMHDRIRAELDKWDRKHERG